MSLHSRFLSYEYTLFAGAALHQSKEALKLETWETYNMLAVGGCILRLS